MAGIAAVVVLLASILARPDEVRVSVAGTFVGPELPLYARVSRPTFAAGSTMDMIQARGVVRVGIKYDQPSFGTVNSDTGEVQGFDAEIAKLIAVGIFGGNVGDVEEKVQWVQAASRNRESLLQDGAVDIVVATYSITERREAMVSFAGPYYISTQDIMVNSADTSIGGVADLAGRRVCTAQGSTSYDTLVSSSPDALPVVRDTYSECAQALFDGQVDAVTTDRAILAGYLLQGGGTFTLLGRPFGPEERYGIGLHKGDEALRTFLNQRLIEMVANGDWSQAARYSIANVEPMPPQVASP